MATDIRLKEGLPEITEALVATYTESRYISHLGHKPLPSREAVIDIVADLLDVLYPGFGRRQNLHIGNVEYHVGDLIDGLQLDLDRASAIAHRIAPEEGPPRPAEPRFIVALESPTANPIAIEVLLAADAILLLVRKGVTRIPQARKIIEIAGRERIIGAVLDVE